MEYPRRRLPPTIERAAPDGRLACTIRRKAEVAFQLVFPRFFKSGRGRGGSAPKKAIAKAGEGALDAPLVLPDLLQFGPIVGAYVAGQGQYTLMKIGRAHV